MRWLTKERGVVGGEAVSQGSEGGARAVGQQIFAVRFEGIETEVANQTA